MLISELIDKLEEIEQQSGNVEVYIQDSSSIPFDKYRIHEVIREKSENGTAVILLSYDKKTKE